MFLNNKKSETDINNEFENKKSILSQIIYLIAKYKLIFFITIFIMIIVVIMLMLVNSKGTNTLVLNGEETIKIYQGTDYIEPGFNAYNSKDKDLNNQVSIKSNLNTKMIGEYEITYTFKDIIKTRKIIVTEKPKEQTYIYLKTINNDTNIYLQKNEKYIEPGYTVFSTSESNLTDKVKITGFVDTSKKGSYRLVYTVINSDNVSISASRTVIVMDAEISLTLNNEKYTSDNVIINVRVADEYFDYMTLPDNTKSTSTKHSYQVSTNGKYTFTVYNKKGTSKKQTIEVKNIDKQVPNGSCSGSYKSGVSTININAYDNIGIEKYILNGQTYTNNKITINKELSNVSIKIYDKANNMVTITCNLKDLNDKVITETPKPTTPSTPTTPPKQEVQEKPNNSQTAYPRYNLTESQLKSIAMLCQREQSSSIGAAAEASLMANRFELFGSKFGTGATGLYNYIRNSGWWASSKKHMDNVSGLNSTVLSAVRDVLINGNRTLPKYVDEHDCIYCGSYGYDIVKIVTDGKTITDKNQLLNHSNYIKDRTKIYNKYGAVYTFHSFPTEKSDPFGYTDIAKNKTSK